jgi:dihydrodiol dehydrogenase / D-xylose 1-dehydrogenase (NADP)
MKKIRWGILATGGIAHAFVKDVQTIPDAEVVAVGSRKLENAINFADKFNIKKRHGSYEDLANNPDVDIIYIATPHPYHAENCILCLKAGKHVLCEKPFTVNANEAKEVIKIAGEKKLFIMEAMWSRFLPVYTQAKKWVDEGLIGEVKTIFADFGFFSNLPPEGRALNPALAGGALLDVGIYPLSFAYWILGEPEKITAMAHIGFTGVDEQSTMTLGYKNGALAILFSAVQTVTPKSALIIGTKGTIEIQPAFFRSKGASIITPEGTQKFDLPYESDGKQYQAMEAMKCIREGKTESPIMPWNETIKIMETMDEIRKQIGLKYPME